MGEVDKGGRRGKEEASPRNDTGKHGNKMRRQKKDWTSAYAKVTKARGEENKGGGIFS